jgi:glucose-6-phosphate-specific signal transduction histidine kinase
VLYAASQAKEQAGAVEVLSVYESSGVVLVATVVGVLGTTVGLILLGVEVADDGNGLPEAYRAGVGISSMRERATELGGSCHIGPREPRGTLVSAALPLGDR